MITYWQASITNNKTTSSVGIGGHENVSQMISDAIREAIYIQARNPGAIVTISDIKEICRLCNNTGIIQRKFRTLRCPQCRWKAPTGHLDDITLKMPDPADGIALTQVV